MKTHRKMIAHTLKSRASFAQPLRRKHWKHIRCYQPQSLQKKPPCYAKCNENCDPATASGMRTNCDGAGRGSIKAKSGGPIQVQHPLPRLFFVPASVSRYYLKQPLFSVSCCCFGVFHISNGRSADVLALKSDVLMTHLLSSLPRCLTNGCNRRGIFPHFEIPLSHIDVASKL